MSESFLSCFKHCTCLLVRDIVTQAESPLTNSKFWGRSSLRERVFEMWVLFLFSYVYFNSCFSSVCSLMSGSYEYFLSETVKKTHGRCFKLVTNHMNTKTRANNKVPDLRPNSSFFHILGSKALCCFVEDYCGAIIFLHSFDQIDHSWVWRCLCVSSQYLPAYQASKVDWAKKSLFTRSSPLSFWGLTFVNSQAATLELWFNEVSGDWGIDLLYRKPRYSEFAEQQPKFSFVRWGIITTCFFNSV